MRDDTPIFVFDTQVAGPSAASGDCACADSRNVLQSSRTTQRFNPSATYTCSSSFFRVPLNEDYTAVFDLFADTPCVVLNQAALRVLDAFLPDQAVVLKEQVSREAVRTLAELGFLRPIDNISSRPDSPDTLVAWLHVTGKCNLACSYCYLPCSNETMSAEIGEAAVKAVFRTAQDHGSRMVKIKYAGGEATLNFQRVLAIQDHAIELARTYGISLESIILSNGIGLTSDMITELKRRQLPIMISLDGVGQTHDAQRQFANGRGSFDRVAYAIDQLIAAKHPPVISITVTARNIAGLSETLGWILDRDLRFSLNFYRETDISASTANLRLSESRLIEEMRRAYVTIERRLPHFSLLDSLLDRAHFVGQHKYACGAGNNYIVIDPNGNIAQCQMNIQETVANVFMDDPLSSIRLDTSRLNNLPVEEKSGCRDCQWRYWCAGGCPLETFRATGRWDVPSPNCTIYRTLLPELLKLEGLRLLKYG